MTAVTMEYRRLGCSGVEVSTLCYGGNTFGMGSTLAVAATRPGNTDESSTHELLDTFAQLGGNFIDTADMYSGGNSERIIGTWLARQKREKFVIATKVGFPVTEDIPNSKGLSRKHIMEGVEESLRRLGTHYIDLYYMHAWGYNTAPEEYITAMNDLVRMGKVHNIGVCNVTGWQLQKLVDITKQRNLAPIVACSGQYSLLERGMEMELVDVCEAENISILPYMPLKSGWLTGKVTRGPDGAAQAPEGTRIDWASNNAEAAMVPSNVPLSTLDNDHTWRVLGQMEKVAASTGKTMAQVALRWLLQKDCVTSVVFGAKNHQQLTSNMAAASGWQLSDAQMKQLDDVSKKELLYPYNMISSIKYFQYR